MHTHTHPHTHFLSRSQGHGGMPCPRRGWRVPWKTIQGILECLGKGMWMGYVDIDGEVHFTLQTDNRNRRAIASVPSTAFKGLSYYSRQNMALKCLQGEGVGLRTTSWNIMCGLFAEHVVEHTFSLSIKDTQKELPHHPRRGAEPH